MVHWLYRTHSLWVAISYFSRYSQPRNWTWVSCTAGRSLSPEPPEKPLKIRLDLIHHSCSESLNINMRHPMDQKAGWNLADIKICFEDSRPVVFTMEHTSASLRGLIQIPAPGPRVSDSVCLGWGQRICVCNNFLGDASAGADSCIHRSDCTPSIGSKVGFPFLYSQCLAISPQYKI